MFYFNKFRERRTQPPTEEELEAMWKLGWEYGEEGYFPDNHEKGLYNEVQVGWVLGIRLSSPAPSSAARVTAERMVQEKKETMDAAARVAMRVGWTKVARSARARPREGWGLVFGLGPVLHLQ